MSFALCAEAVRAPGTTANSPTSPVVQSSLMHVECCDISQSSQFNEQSIEPSVPFAWPLLNLNGLGLDRLRDF
jgi:hypothetical protein